MEKMKNNEDTMVGVVFEVSKIASNRTKYEVLSKLMEEVGELSKEVGIDQGYQLCPEGKDGIIGECIDVIVVTLDLIYLHNPDITEEELLTIMKSKVGKWRSYCNGSN